MRLFRRPVPVESDSSEETESIPEPVLAPDTRTAEQIDKDNFKDALAEAMARYGAQGDAAFVYDEDPVSVLEEAPIVRLANTILQQAIKEKASSILVEPDRRGLRVRYRVDGILHETMTMPNYIKAPLTARYVVMSELSLAAHGLPQQGSLGISYEGVPFEVRVSSLPTANGEQLSLKIIDHRKAWLGFAQLGFTPEVHAQTEELIQRPGLLLVAGPAVSGKSTTLYNCAARLNSVERHIISIDSECEYRLRGLTQIRIDGQSSMTYATAIRAALREDADIILVERVPDLAAWQAILTAVEDGKLVLASFAAGASAIVLMRLLEMGMEPARLADNLTGILAQRLVRRVCVNCREEYEVEAESLRELGMRTKDPHEKFTLARGIGCEQCRKTGYKGQIGLFELLRMDEWIADKMVRRASRQDLKYGAQTNGMVEMREDGMIKILEGLTTPDEVRRVVSSY